MSNVPRHVERLRIGGGFGNSPDGGADIEADGTLRTDGDIVVRGILATGSSPQPLTNSAGEIDGARLQLQSVKASHLDPQGDYTLANLTVSGSITAGNGLAGHNRTQGVSLENLIWLCHFESTKNENESAVGDTYLDWTGNDRHLKVYNEGTVCKGKIGKGIQFSGINGHARTSNTEIAELYGGASLTLTAWIKTTELSAEHRVIMGFVGPGPYYPYVRVALFDGKAQARVRGNDSTPVLVVEGNTPIHDGKWHHIAVTIPQWGTSAKIRLYVDGALEAEATDTRTATSACVSYFFVGSANGAAQFFKGAIDEIAIWNRYLHPEEIRALYLLSTELPNASHSGIIPGALKIPGGNLECGLAGTQRGILTVAHGAGGAAAGCVKLHSFNGNAWYLFVDNDGVLRLYTTLPSSGNDGTVVGSQG